MGMYGCVSQKFLQENIGYKIKIHVRDVPDTVGELLDFGNGDILVLCEDEKQNKRRCLIDLNSVIGITEV